MTNLTQSKKIIIFIASICLYGMFFVSSARADTIDVYQNIGDQSTTTVGIYSWTQGFRPHHNLAEYMTFKLCKGQNMTNATIKICDSAGVTTVGSTQGCAGSTLYSRDVKDEINAYVVSCGVPEFYTFDLGTFSMSANTNYSVLFNIVASQALTLNFAYTNTNPYADGFMTYSIHNYISGENPVYVASSSDLFFQTYYAPQDSISITAPTNGSTIPDFPAFQIEYDTLYASSSYQAKVYYGTNPNDLYFFDQTDVSSFPSASWVVNKTYAFENNLWYAQAFLKRDGATTASSSVISFTISSTSTADYLAGEILTVKYNTSIDICYGIDTSGFYGAVECAMKKVVDWSFTPSLSTKIEMSATVEQFKDSFPFNMYYGLTDAVDDALSTTTDKNNTFNLPMIRQTGTGTEFYMLPVVSSSSLPAMIGSSNATLFRNTIGWLLWIGCATIIYFTIRERI